MQKIKSYKPKPNYFWSVSSVAAVLFLLGLFVFISLHSHDLVDHLKEDFEMVAELSGQVSSEEIDQLTTAFREDELVMDGSISYVSKEDGLKDLSKELGSEILEADMPNPLSDVITFHISAEHFSPEVLSEIRDKYQQSYSFIAGIYYQEGLIDQVLANLDRASFLFLLGGVILGVLALTLIHNSVRLALYANRFLVKNMELVGASWNFIRRPFLIKGVKNGLMSGLVALVALTLFGFVLLERVPELVQFLNLEYLAYLAAIVVGSGVLINLCSTFFVVTKFLKMRTGLLHA